MSDNKDKVYRYKKYLRDGSVKEITAVIRSKRKPKKEKTK